MATLIESFRSKETQALFEGKHALRSSAIEAMAVRKLTLHAAARTLAFLRSPPGNRFEALEGDRVGQYRTRINDQWRVCLSWTDQGPADVEIVDYC